MLTHTRETCWCDVWTLGVVQGAARSSLSCHHMCCSSHERTRASRAPRSAQARQPTVVGPLGPSRRRTIAHRDTYAEHRAGIERRVLTVAEINDLFDP